MIDPFYLTLLLIGVLGGIIAYYDYKMEKEKNQSEG